MIEARGVWLGLSGGVKAAIAVPFSREAGGVAGLLQELGNGDLGRAHVDTAIAGDEVVNASTIWAASGHESDTRG